MKTTSPLKLKLVVAGLLGGLLTVMAADPTYWSWAQTPPMGWNSWDGFATTVTESQTRAQTDVMKTKLAAHGWNLITVNIQWYEPNATGFDYHQGAKLEMDGQGRLLPGPINFHPLRMARGSNRWPITSTVGD